MLTAKLLQLAAAQTRDGRAVLWIPIEDSGGNLLAETSLRNRGVDDLAM
jgi:hypothetical protein